MLLVEDLNTLLNTKYVGKKNLSIEEISSIKNASKNSVIFVSQISQINIKNIYKAGVILTSKDIAKCLPNSNILIADNPKLKFAELTNIFFKIKNNKKDSRSSNKTNGQFFKGNDVFIGSNFSHGINVVIEDNVKIGNNVFLGHNVVLHSGVKIGSNVSIESGSVIGSEGFGNILDQNNKWLHIKHLGSVFISDNVSIGSNCCIDSGTLDDTTIESGVIIDNSVHIAHNVHIGQDSAIAAKVGIAGSCVIGKRNMIGGMVGIVDHIKTTDDVIISATSTVTKDIKAPGTYTGIMPMVKHSRWKRIALWITKLDKIARFMDLKTSKL